MARKPKPGSKPSFFKILTQDFTRGLKLPSTFVRKYGKALPKRCKLITSYGQQTIFDVRIEKTNGGKQCCFTGSGWNKFVKDLGLQIGELIIMCFDGKLEFDVSVFGTNGIEKETFSRKPEPVEFSEDENVSEEQGLETEAGGDTGVGGDELRPRYTLLLKESHRFRTTFPFGFALKTGLIGENAVVLRYLPNKTHWAVLLKKRARNWHELSVGWSNFRKENRLIYGNTYSFTFNSIENVIQVELVRKK